MTQPKPAADTAERSLAHWSEDGRAEMEAFYALARLDYELLAGVLDWRGLLAALRVERSQALTLLDIACGSGKFPEALMAHAGLEGLKPIQYDLLDPSEFSLAEAAAVLRAPFHERDQFACTLEDLPAAQGPWDVVWATHALYALDPTHLAAAVSRYRAAVRPAGFAFLAQGARDGHYLRVYAAFLEGVRPEGTPYVSSDDLIAELRAQGADPAVRRLSYDHVIPAADTALLEGYLHRCLFDDTLPLSELLRAPVLGEYLAAQLDEAAGVYRFHQEVDCVVLSDLQGGIPWTAAS